MFNLKKYSRHTASRKSLVPWTFFKNDKYVENSSKEDRILYKNRIPGQSPQNTFKNHRRKFSYANKGDSHKDTRSTQTQTRLDQNRKSSQQIIIRPLNKEQRKNMKRWSGKNK